MQPQRGHGPQWRGLGATISQQYQRRDIATALLNTCLPFFTGKGWVWSLSTVCFPWSPFLGLPAPHEHDLLISFSKHQDFCLLREPPDEMGHGLREVCAPSLAPAVPRWPLPNILQQAAIRALKRGRAVWCSASFTCSSPY